MHNMLIGIPVVGVGIGNDWSKYDVACFMDEKDMHKLIIGVERYDDESFEKIMPAITDLTCPASYELVISEISYGHVENGGSHFIELYNPSIYVNLSKVSINGLFTANPISNTLGLEKGQYLVLYDGDSQDINCADCECVKSAGNPSMCHDAVYINCGENCTYTKNMVCFVAHSKHALACAPLLFLRCSEKLVCGNRRVYPLVSYPSISNRYDILQFDLSSNYPRRIHFGSRVRRKMERILHNLGNPRSSNYRSVPFYRPF